MCGIFGYIGSQRLEGAAAVLQGLKFLEYRGYDSAGLAGFSSRGELLHLKSVGKVAELERLALSENIALSSAIAHTRWATHGAPVWENAHPQLDAGGTLALVHNGIVENYAPLRRALQERGAVFTSDTDTEVLAHLISQHFEGDLLVAITRTCQQLKGSFAFALVHREYPDQIFAVAKDSPLVLGIGDDEIFVASDLNAFLPHTERVVFLQSGEIAHLNCNRYRIWSLGGEEIERAPETIGGHSTCGTKGGFAHFMLKEIHEQPSVVRRALVGRSDPERASARFEELEAVGLDRNRLAHMQRVLIVGCGTSWHAGCIGAMWLEEWARLPSQAEISSEFRYKNPIILPDTLVLAISQSGETADTIAAVRELKARGVYVVGLCNVEHSTLAREVDATLALRAELEVSVCSTKAFTSQLITLALFSLMVGRTRDLPRERGEEILRALNDIPEQIQDILARSDEIRMLARRYSRDEHLFYIGRRYMFPAALEGALKLKEISYINANGYASGELKHGPIALIGPNCATVALVADRVTLEKLISNILEIKARSGRVLAVANQNCGELAGVVDDLFVHAETLDALAPVLSSIFGQLFAYFVALDCERDIDTPRNLAKSVTVE